MGNVYEAEDRRDNSRVALKLMWPHLNEDESFRLRFEREAHAAALLRSPYAVKLLDYGSVGPSAGAGGAAQAYLVMEYVDGESLEAVRMAGDIARALEEAQARSIVHRDLKPDNILIDRDGRAHVADFGVAHMAGGSGTVTGGFVGTARYCAPEQMTGAVDHRSDQYALGVMLYEMLTGKPPFAGSAPELWRQHAEAPFPLEALAGQPHALIDIVERCTEKQPNSRFPVPADLLVALAKVEASLKSPLAAFAPAPVAPAPVATPPSAPVLHPEPISVVDGDRASLPSSQSHSFPVARPDIAVPPPSVAPLPVTRIEPVELPRPPMPTPQLAVLPVPLDQPYQENGRWFARTANGVLTWDDQSHEWIAPDRRRAELPLISHSKPKSLWPAAGTVLAAMGILMILAFVAAALAGRQAALGDGASFDEFVSRDDAKDVALGFQIFAAIAVVLALMWLTQQANANARALNPRAKLTSTGLAVGSWLIPMVNLVLPFVALHQIWVASALPSRPPGSPSSRAWPNRPVLIWAWCAAAAVSFVLSMTTFGLDSDPEDLLGAAIPVTSSFTLHLAPAALIQPEELRGHSQAIMYLQIVLGLMPPVGMAAVWALAKRQAEAARQAGP